MIKSYQCPRGTLPLRPPFSPMKVFRHMTHSKLSSKTSNACLLKWPEFFQENFLSWLDFNCWLGEAVEFYLLTI